MGEEDVQAQIGSYSNGIPVFSYHLPPVWDDILCVERSFPEGAERVVGPWENGESTKVWWGNKVGIVSLRKLLSWKTRGDDNNTHIYFLEELERTVCVRLVSVPWFH
jgi:hypothetical protein